MVRDAILVFGVILSLCVGALLFSGDITGMQTAGHCGDGVVDAGEICDDGNMLAGDGCSPSCQAETSALTPAFQERTTEVDIPAYALDSVVARVVDLTGQGEVRIVEKAVPPRIAVAFTQPVYRSFEATVVAGTVTRVVFEFKVTKEWLSGKEVSPDAVVLYRYTSQWDALETVMVDEDEVFFYYRTETPGLSYFILSIKSAPQEGQETSQQDEAQTQTEDTGITIPTSQPPAAVNEPARPEVITRESPSPGTQTGFISSILILAILAIVTGGALILFRRPRPVRKTRATSVDLDETLDAFDRDIDANDVSAAKHHLARMERLLEEASPAVRSSYTSRVQDAFTRLGKL